MRRLRALAALLLLVAFEATAWWALRAAGSIERWQVDTSDVGRWLDQSTSIDIAAGVIRLVAMVVVGWLAVTTVLYVLASVTRVRSLIRVTGALTLPSVRRLVERAAVVGVGVTMAMPAASAFAHSGPAGGWADAPPAVVATVGAPVPDTAVAPTIDQLGDWPVVTGDNLWFVAEAVVARALGIDQDAVRSVDVLAYWHELCDRNASALASHDPNLIFPAEHVDLPRYEVRDGAVVPLADGALPTNPTTVVPPAPVVTPPAPLVVAPPVATSPVAAPAPSSPTTATVPTVAPARPTAVERAGDPIDLDAAVVTTDAPRAADPAPRLRTAAVAERGMDVGHMVQLGGGGLLCFALATYLVRQRRPRARRRQPGDAMPALTPDMAATEMALLVGADPEAAGFLEAGMRAFSALVGQTDLYSSVDLPSPLGVVVGPDRMEIVLARQAPGVAPFVDSGERWVLERPSDLAELHDLGGGAPMPSPSLICLGRDQQGAEVLIDLEDPGMVALRGSGPDGMAIAVEMVVAAGLHLAASPWLEFCHVVLVGFDAPPDIDNVRAVDELDDELFDQWEDEANRVSGRLQSVGCDSTYEARIRRLVPDAWVPTVVVCARPLPDDHALRLVGLVNDPVVAGFGVLAVGPVDGAPWTFVVNPEGLYVDPLATTVVAPQRVTAQEAVDLRDLLESADAEPVPAPPLSHASDTMTAEVIVRVLGPIRVDGLSNTMPAKSTEALVYVACNRHRGVDGDRLIEALWPGSNPEHSRGTMQNTTWKLRQKLGTASTGQPHMRALVGGQRLYTLEDTVTTDLDIVEAALASANRQPSRAARARLVDAQGYVAGQPFDHAGRGYEWAISEGAVARAERAVTDAAHRLAELCLDDPDPDPEEAVWAAHQGLVAAPRHEQLLRDLMRADAARGNRAGIEAWYDQALRAAEDEDMDPDPLTVELHRELLSRAG